MTLAEFLAARLGDDEAAAEAAIAEEPEGECGCPPGDWSYRDRVGSRDDYGVLYHEMRHDPARVLREVEAGRKILGRSRYVGDDYATRCLAAVYADHPDYDEAWAPGVRMTP
jgi:hypothetical protein